MSVNYDLSRDKRGRACAINVFPQRGHKEVTKAGKQKVSAIILSSAFISLVIALVVLHKLPPTVLGVYLVASLLTFGLYARDKSAALSGNWRISESTLHLFSLIGGWPGAAIAQSQLRHKSKKTSFRAMYWITVVINCGILGWLLTPDGTHELESLLRNLISINL